MLFWRNEMGYSIYLTVIALVLIVILILVKKHYALQEDKDKGYLK